MAIEKKLIHFGKLADFEAQLTAGNILDYSIVFIQDAKKIWTHGTYYDCSEGGASEGTSNYYITEFTYYDFYNAASENGQLQISANDVIGLIDSIERGSRILIPYGDSVSGYAIMLGENDNGEVYVAVYSTRDVITALFFENDIRQGNNLTFDNDVVISNAIAYEADTASRPNTLAVRDSSGAIETNGIIDDQGNWWVTPTSSEESRNAADAILQWEITDLEEIREGASKGATAVQPSALPTKVSQLENDRNFVDEQTLSKYVKKETFAGLDTAQASAISGGGMLYALPDQANGGEDDILLSRDSVKTINGESIYGGGDITIEGESLTESDIAAMGFTKNTGTYSKPSGGIPKSDLASAVQTSLGKADTALQSYTEQYKGTVTGVKMNGASKGSSGVVDLGNVVTGVKINGSTKSPSSGVVDLGTVITSHQDISGKQDKLVSGTNIKTINGESILGSGDITISGGGVSEDYVNTAIANAITTTLNTAV